MGLLVDEVTNIYGQTYLVLMQLMHRIENAHLHSQMLQL